MRLALVLVLSASAAVAEPPRLDVEATCELASFDGDGVNLPVFNYCIDLAQSTYDSIKVAWDSYPEPIRRQCESTMNNMGGGSYEHLRLCINSELVGPVQKKTFSY